MLYDQRDYSRLRNVVLLVSGLAWLAVVTSPDQSCHGPALHFGDSVAASLRALASMASGWFVMLVAMMLPMTLHALYQIRLSSLAARRGRSSGLFLVGYLSIWMIAGAVLVSIELGAKGLAPGSYLPALVVAVIAVVWQASPFKQECLNRCHSHRTPAAFGLAADWDALRAGLDHGRWCVGSCWATMLLPLLLPVGHVAGMAAVTVLMVCERIDPPVRPAWRLRGFHTALRIAALRVFGPRASPSPYLV